MAAPAQDQDEILAIAETVGDVNERVQKLETAHDSQTAVLDTARAVLDAAVKGLGALRSQVLENDIAKLQLALNDKARELATEISRFETAVAEIDRRAEEGDATLKTQLAAESAKLRADADALRTQLASYQEWGGKVEHALKEHAEKLAAIPAAIRGAEGRSVNPRGKFESGQKYARLDIAEVAGSSWISTEDDNDEKPSASSKKWKLLAKRGSGGSGGGGGISGDINALAGVAAISQGGTGQTTAILAARALLDGISTTRGTVIFRGASGWTELAPGTPGHFLSTQGAGADPIFVAASGSGLGDFSGPASSTDNAIVRFDGAGGKNGQNSGVTISDSNVVAITGASSGLTIAGTTVATSTTSGALQCSGGAGIAGALFVGGNVNLPNAFFLAGRNAANDSNVALIGYTAANKVSLDPNGFGVIAAGALSIGGNLNLKNAFFVAGRNAANDSDVALIGYTASDKVSLDPNGFGVVIGGTVSTAAPSGSTAGAWKLGAAASVSPTSPNRTIAIDIGGTVYYLHAKTSND